MAAEMATFPVWVLTLSASMMAAVTLLVIGILHFKAGGLIVQGRGRILQTILAVLNVGNIPLSLSTSGGALLAATADPSSASIAFGRRRASTS